MQLVFEGVEFRREEWSMQISATFGPGIHLISGPIGCGKSTLALLASGLLQPSKGAVRAEGIRSSMLSLQFPEYHVTAGTLAGEVASWGLDVTQILSRTGLEGREQDDPAWLSRGELKRLELACAMAVSSDLLILDEPFSSLDCREKELLAMSLPAARARILLLVTHEPWFLPRVDEIHILGSGRLKSLGRVPEAIARWTGAPDHIRALLREGITPTNISPADCLEAKCRMHVSG